MAEYEINNPKLSRINSVIHKKQGISMTDNRRKLTIQQMRSEVQNNRYVIQQKEIPVGYDSIGYGTGNDILVTSGLANCIAIVAYDREKKRAALGHFDTSQALVSEDTFDESVLRNFKLLIERTCPFEGKIEYHICLGRVWFDTAKKGREMPDLMRYNLIGSCINVFGTEPHMCGYTATFYIESGKISGDLNIRSITSMPDNWAKAGDSIPYENLRRK